LVRKETWTNSDSPYLLHSVVETMRDLFLYKPWRVLLVLQGVCVCVPFIFNCLLGANPDDFIPAVEQQNIVLEVHAFGTWNGTDEPSYNGAVIISGDEKVCGSPVREFEQRYEYNNTMSMWFRKAIWSIVYDTVLLENHLHAYYTYTWKCNNERPYIGILNKQKCLLKKQWWLERQNTCWLRVGTSGSGEDIKKGVGG
jgi:hypothetical protein